MLKYRVTKCNECFYYIDDYDGATICNKLYNKQIDPESIDEECPLPDYEENDEDI